MKAEKNTMGNELNEAIKHHDVKKVALLLAQGADANQNFDAEGSVLMYAIVRGFIDIVSLLLKHGARINEIVNGYTPLMGACGYGHKDIVELLLKNGADINLGEFRNPILVAIEYQQADIVAILLKHGADVSVCDGHSHTPLHNAAWQGLEKIVQMLLAHNAAVNAKTKFGETPLLLVARGLSGTSVESRIRVAQILLEHKADPNICADSGCPLDEAFGPENRKRESLEIAKLLIGYGAIISQDNNEYFKARGVYDDLIANKEPR